MTRRGNLGVLVALGVAGCLAPFLLLTVFGLLGGQCYLTWWADDEVTLACGYQESSRPWSFNCSTWHGCELTR